MKKLLVFFAGVMLILSVAPAALAEHCLRCRVTRNPDWTGCIPATGTLLPGHTECYDDGGTTCYTAGEQCEPHGGGFAPLAAEFTVAAVERLDEPRTGADETLVAAAETDKPATR